MAENFDGFQILVAAIAVRYPLTVLASIVQIKHGRYGIHAQTVYVELLDPVEMCIRDSKNITIPTYQNLVTTIGNALEEKDREEFTRLKVIKRSKTG